jgi:hypothetical protein
VTTQPDASSRHTDPSGAACSRREFLVLALAALCGAASGSGCGRSDPLRPAECQQPGDLPATVLDLQALLARYFEYGDVADVRAIGRAYIERFGGNGCALVDDLAQAVRGIADVTTIEEAVQALEAAVTTDFDFHRRTAVGGWQLATTEARLCALAEHLAAASGR